MKVEDASFDVKAVGDFLVAVGANVDAVVDAATRCVWGRC